MKTYDFEPILQRIRGVLASHCLADGLYSRYLPRPGEDARPNPYGCADAANILYTIDDFPRDPALRAKWIENLRSMQDEDGLFRESTHHVIHTTAHCIAALELFDASPTRPCTALDKYKNPDMLTALLEETDHRESARGHIGAGIYVIMQLTGAADRAWCDAYFDWYWQHTDPQTGFWHTDKRGQGHDQPLWQYMGDGFHYLFNIESAHMPLRYPEKMIDTCLYLYDTPGALPDDFGTRAHFLETDLLYCLSRASRQTPHRFADIRDRLTDFAGKYYGFLMDADWERRGDINDLHLLFGTLCAFATLQSALPGTIRTHKPLRLVLDRRPFI